MLKGCHVLYIERYTFYEEVEWKGGGAKKGMFW